MRTGIVSLMLIGAVATLACNPAPLSPELLPFGTHESAITSVIGPGSGGVSVTPKSIPEGTMAVDIIVTITDARPNASYIVQRAPDVGRGLQSDGICQRALGLPPWDGDPPAPAFLTFTIGTGPAVLTTGSNGIGSLAWEFRNPTIPAGTLIDVMFRLVDNETSPTTELRSGCFTIAVK